MNTFNINYYIPYYSILKISFKKKLLIFIHQLDFKSPKDYYTYEWSVSGADETGQDGCMVLFDDVPEEHGYYMFGYWSRSLECVLGFSEPFLVSCVLHLVFSHIIQCAVKTNWEGKIISGPILL